MRKSSEVMSQIYSKKVEEAKKKKRKTSSEILAERNINFKDIKQEKDTSGLFKGSSAFDNGYQFGDISKTIGSTVGDLALDIAEGFIRTTEGVADALQYGLAWGFDKLGADAPAEWLKENAKFNSTGALFGKNENAADNFSKGWTDKIEQNSVSGDFGDSVAQGVGNVGAFVGLGALTGGSSVATALTSFSSGYGNARSQAYENGADDKTSHTTGLINGFAEAISEQFFNIGGKKIKGVKVAGWGEKLTGKIGGAVEKYFGTNTGKIVKEILDVSGEGFEEILSNVFTATGNDIAHFFDKNFTYGMEGQTGNILEDIGKQLTSKESWGAFVSATLTSAIVNGGNTFVTNAQKNNILKSYAKENDITVEEAKAQLEKTVNAQVETNLPFAERLEAQEKVQSKQLEYMKKGVFVEQGQKDQAFQYKETDNAQVNNMLKSLSEKSNNSVENHATAQMAEKLIRDLGYDVEFVTSEDLKALNRPENAAGYKEGNKIVLNLNSNELASFVMGHETTHFLEQETELYDAVSESLFELAKTKGKYDGDVANLSKTYEKVINEKIKSEETALGRSLTEEETAKITESVIKSELTANYVGNFFTDEDFFRTLGKKDPNLLQKFSEFLKKLYYQVTGQEEKAQILKAQQNIRKVYQEYAQNQANTETKVTESTNLPVAEETSQEQAKNDKIQYSLTDNQGRELSKEQEPSYMWHSSSKANIDLIKQYGFRYDKESSYFATDFDISKGYGEDMIMLDQNEFNIKDVTQELEGNDNRKAAREKAIAEGYDGIRYQTSKNNYDVEITNVEKLNEVVKKTEAENQRLAKALMGEDYSLSNQSDYALYTPKKQFKNKLSDGLIKTEETVAEENLPYTETTEKVETPVEETKTQEVDLGDKSVLNNTINKNSIKAKENAVKVAKSWLNLKDSKKQEFKDALDKFTKMTQEELLTNDSYEEIRKIVDRYSENEIVYTTEDVKEIKNRIRNAKIKVTDDLKAQITDYGYFRKSNMGKLRLAKTGTYIDTLWQELSEMYPHYFDREILAEADMLYALSDFMNEDFTVTEKFMLEEDDITEITNDVFDTILENSLNKKQIEDLTAKDNELKKMKKVDVENIRTAESVIGTQEEYLSSRAEELFNELKGLKKGVRASGELSQILNLGYRWSDIKAALSNIKWKPGMEVNSKNTDLGDIETTIKEMINEEYQNKVQDLIFDETGAKGDLTKEDTVKLKRFNYAKEVESLKDALESTSKELEKTIIEKQAEYDGKANKDTSVAQKLLQQISALKIRKANIELDYNKRIGNLTEKIKNFDVKEETRRLNRAEYKQILRDEISPLIENASKWADKKVFGGFRYAREVAQRNIVDVAGDVEGNAINEYVFNPVQEHEASKNRRIKEKFETIKELKLDLKETYEIDGEKVGEDDLVRRYIENSINKVELDQIGADSNKIIQAADKISDMLESLFTDLNTELKKMGLPEVEHRKDYFPHGAEDKQDTFLSKLANAVGIDITNQELPTEIAGRTDEFKPNRAWNGHLLRRKGNKTNTDAIGNLEKYIAGVEDIIAHTEDIQKVRTLSQEIRNQFTDEQTLAKIEAINNNDSLSDVEKDDLIKEIYKRENSQLSGLVTWLDDYANVLSNKKSFADREMERKIGRNAYTSMANIEGIIAANTIGGNASVSLTNFAPIVQALSTTKGHNMIKAVLDVMKNDINTLSGKENNSIKDMSDFLTNRFGTEGIGRKTWKDKIKNIAFKPMEIVDNFTSEVIVRAKYYENLQNGMDTNEAIKKADRDAAKIMADRSKGAMPTIFNEKNPFSKLITMFQVEPNNIISNYTKDMSRDAESKGQLAYQYTKLAVGSYIFNSILMGIRGGNEVLPDPIRFVQYLIQAITGDDDEKEKAGENMLEAITGAIPFVSNVAGLLGMEDVGRIPISSALPDLTELVNLGDDEVSDEYKWQVVRDEILKPLSYFLLPTGAAQVWKTVQGIEAVAKGGSYKYTKDGELKMQFPVEDANVLDYAKAGLFGKYSLDEAKTYIDSGFKSLTEKQTQAYEKLNLPYADYLEYLDGITDAKREAKANDESQTEAVYDYIYNLPLSTEQKNIMLNSALGKKDTVTDENGYIKYVNSKNRTYWYDAENDKLYNNNYHEVDSSMLNELTQYSSETDITDYANYGSLEEFNYANNYPEKHLAITQIADFDTYNEYKDYIEDISNHYSDMMDGATNSKQKTAISNQKKQAIRQYINSLNLNQYQKLMLEKLAGGYSIKNYKSQIQKYINSLDLSKAEKEAIDSALFD